MKRFVVMLVVAVMVVAACAVAKTAKTETITITVGITHRIVRQSEPRKFCPEVSKVTTPENVNYWIAYLGNVTYGDEIQIKSVPGCYVENSSIHERVTE